MLAILSRLRVSQGSSRVSGSVCVMMNQLGSETNEIGTEAVAHDRVRGFQFDAGDQFGIDRDLDQNRVSEDAGEHLAAGLDFLRRHRAGGSEANGCPFAPMDARVPSGSFASPVAIPSIKAATRASSGSRSSSLVAISMA